MYTQPVSDTRATRSGDTREGRRGSDEDGKRSPVIAVGAVVVDRGGRVLLVRRARPPSAGAWTLPGGRVERGESLGEAVVRELREEAAVSVEVKAPLCVVVLEREGYAYEIHEHLVVPAGDARPEAGDDAAEARWVTRDDLASLGVLPDAVEVIDQGLAAARARGLITAAGEAS